MPRNRGNNARRCAGSVFERERLFHQLENLCPLGVKATENRRPAGLVLSRWGAGSQLLFARNGPNLPVFVVFARLRGRTPTSGRPETPVVAHFPESGRKFESCRLRCNCSECDATPHHFSMPIHLQGFGLFVRAQFVNPAAPATVQSNRPRPRVHAYLRTSQAWTRLLFCAGGCRSIVATPGVAC